MSPTEALGLHVPSHIHQIPSRLEGIIHHVIAASSHPDDVLVGGWLAVEEPPLTLDAHDAVEHVRQRDALMVAFAQQRTLQGLGIEGEEGHPIALKFLHPRQDAVDGLVEGHLLLTQQMRQLEPMIEVGWHVALEGIVHDGLHLALLVHVIHDEVELDEIVARWLTRVHHEQEVEIMRVACFIPLRNGVSSIVLLGILIVLQLKDGVLVG